jgi:hypothetical protein
MGQTEARLGQEIAAILAAARAVDAAEDARYGREASGDEGPAALQQEVDFRQARRARIRAAQVALEARAGGSPPRSERRQPSLDGAAGGLARLPTCQYARLGPPTPLVRCRAIYSDRLLACLGARTCCN